MAKNTRLICAHAYQSYIWNLTATRRVEKYGLQVVAGDLVPINSQGAVVAIDDFGEPSEESVAVTSSATTSSTTTSSTTASSTTDNSFQRSKGKKGDHNIHIVTAEDVAANKFTIHDVILPLPGMNVIVPANDIGEYFESLLAQDGLSLSHYANCHIQYRLVGAYRRVLQQPQHFEWRIVEYSDKDQEIATTELTALRAADAIAAAAVDEEVSATATTSTTSDVAPSENVDAVVAKESEKQQYTALQLKFTLPPGTYATMMLRELTKQSTESAFQAQLSNADTVYGTATTATAAISTATATATAGANNKRSADVDAAVLEEQSVKVARVD